MNKKTYVTKERIKKVANFLKESVEWLKAQDQGCCNYPLDDNLVIAVGWNDGFDMADEDIIKSPNGQHPVNNPIRPWICGWAIEAAIKIRNDCDCANFEFLNYPYWDNEKGDWRDSGISLKPNMDQNKYEQDARWFLNQYVAIINEHKKKNSKLIISL